MSAPLNVPPPAPRRALGPTSDIVLLLAVYLFGLAPYAASFVLMYPDEPHYLDAGVFMCQTGEYLMPAVPNDATPHFIKPILTYWVVVAGYKLLGLNLLAAKLPFLLAGAGILWLTHRLALMLTGGWETGVGSRRAALLAGALLLGNPLFALSAMRCLPDIWLCLFLMMSAYGALGRMILTQPRAGHALLLYVGAGLAVATKGTPALAFLGFLGLFALANPWRPLCWRRLLHWPSLLLGLGLGGAWFVAVALTHGNLSALWTDQVAARVSRDPWLIASRVPLALGLLALMASPILLPLWFRRGLSHGLMPVSPRQRLAGGFILAWTVFSVVLTACTFNFSIRYLLPVFPLVAVYLALTLDQADGVAIQTWFRWVFTLPLGLLAVVWLGSTVICWQLGPTLLELAAAVGLAGCIGLLGWVGLRGPWPGPVWASGLAILLLLPAAYSGASKITQPDIGEQLADRLCAEGLDNRASAGFVGRPGRASRIRLGIPLDAHLYQWERLPALQSAHLPSGLEMPRVLCVPAVVAETLPHDQYEIRPGGSTFHPPGARGLVWAFVHGRLKEYVEQHQEHYAIATRLDSQ